MAETNMIEQVCNFWTERADWRCIPTSGAMTPDGAAIMDTPVGIEAVQKFHNIDYDLGRLIASRGNHVHVIRPGIASFPFKQYAWSGVSLAVVERSARQLAALVGTAKTLLPRPSEPNSNVSWEDIAKVLSLLPDNVLVVQVA